MKITFNELIKTVTMDYLDQLTQNLHYPPVPEIIEEELLEKTNDAIEYHNLGDPDPSVPTTASMKDRYPNMLPRNEWFRRFQALSNYQIALILIYLYGISRIATEGLDQDCDKDLLAMFHRYDKDAGTYVIGKDEMKSLIQQYNALSKSSDGKEVLEIARNIAPRRAKCMDPDLIAVNNGIFNYKTKELMPFDPEVVFLSKSRVNYVDGAVNPVIHNNADGTDWDVCSWINELSDDPEVVSLLWQVLGAILRPNVPWNRSVWLSSVTGNNGKGSLCALMKNLLGKGAWESVPLSAFGKQFMLEPLIHIQAIITDENASGTYLDDCSALKAVITGDHLMIDVKFQQPQTICFRGLMVQCINGMPRLRDKTPSMLRRLLVVPMEKRFEGRERKYIKMDYLNRKEVLEYVLYHVLHDMNFYEFDIPQVCRDALREYQGMNDPLLQFLEEVLTEAQWTLLPSSFLYDCFKQWMKINNPSSHVEGKTTFLKHVKSNLAGFPEWSFSESQVNSAGRMDVTEPLAVKYCLGKWTSTGTLLPNGGYTVDNSDFCLKDRYRGLVRDTSMPRTVV